MALLNLIWKAKNVVSCRDSILTYTRSSLIFNKTFKIPTFSFKNCDFSYRSSYPLKPKTSYLERGLSDADASDLCGALANLNPISIFL